MPCCRVATAASGAAQHARRAKAKEKREAAKEEELAKAAEKEEEEAEPEYTGARKYFHKAIDFLDQTWLQTTLYIVFLLAFQSLTGTMRHPEEFYLDRHISHTFIDNTFDGNHNRLKDIRRISDIWEWCNTVLVPGLFSNADVGESWPDGEGSFHLEGATPLSATDYVKIMNNFDWTQGLMFKQVRAKEEDGRNCYGNLKCFEDMKPSTSFVTEPFADGNTTTELTLTLPITLALALALALALTLTLPITLSLSLSLTLTRQHHELRLGRDCGAPSGGGRLQSLDGRAARSQPQRAHVCEPALAAHMDDRRLHRHLPALLQRGAPAR